MLKKHLIINTKYTLVKIIKINLTPLINQTADYLQITEHQLLYGKAFVSDKENE